jgi:hypothetical protein
MSGTRRRVRLPVSRQSLKGGTHGTKAARRDKARAKKAVRRLLAEVAKEPGRRYWAEEVPGVLTRREWQTLLAAAESRAMRFEDRAAITKKRRDRAVLLSVATEAREVARKVARLVLEP